MDSKSLCFDVWGKMDDKNIRTFRFEPSFPSSLYFPPNPTMIISKEVHDRKNGVVLVIRKTTIKPALSTIELISDTSFSQNLQFLGDSIKEFWFFYNRNYLETPKETM